MSTFDVTLANKGTAGTFNIALSVSAGGQIKYWAGAAWTAKPVKYWDGAAWTTKPIKYWNGSAWTTTTY